MKKLLKQLLLLTTLIAIPVLTPELHDRFLHNKKESVVKVLFPDRGSGTGFVIERNDKKFIITNRHVCGINDGEYMYAEDYNKRLTMIKPLVISKYYDLCLMTSPQDLPSLSLAKSYDLFDNAYLIGYPLGMPLTLEKGRIISRDIITLLINCKLPHDEKIEVPPMFRSFTGGRSVICLKHHTTLRINAMTFGGNSGSPVLNIYGNVQGVLFAGTSRAQNAGYIVPLEHLTNFINSIKFRK